MSRMVSLDIECAQSRQTLHVPGERARLRLSDILRQARMPLNTRCGQRGLCDGCMVELLEGAVQHLHGGEAIRADSTPIPVRACEHRLHEDAERVRLRIPSRSLLAYQPEIVTEYRINVPRAHHPLLQAIDIPRGDLPAGLPPAEALCRALAARLNCHRPVLASPISASQAAELSAATHLHAIIALGQEAWTVTHVADGPPERQLGIAVDVGTTTVVVLLVGLDNGEVLARAAAFNQQMNLGDDVVTRITLCSTDPAMVGRLQEAINLATIAPLVEQALAQAGASPRQVGCLAIAGNTTMLHLVAGDDPSPMGTVPFTPVFQDHRVLSAGELFGSRCPRICREDAAVHLLPSPSAYVGADLAAGVIASGLLYDEGPSLLVDVGTNGEIILKNEGRLLGCATAAGPAFEGAGLSCGIRAGDGAISRVRLSLDPLRVEVSWIGRHDGARPVGLCGSAYIDFLAEARRVGLLGATGRYDGPAASAAGDRLIEWNGHDRALRIAGGEGGQAIAVSQLDISRLMQAKAAIAAGILTLLEREGLDPPHVRRVYLAGGFGTNMSRVHALACGLLPGFRERQVEPVGNTSLAGACMALLDSGLLDDLSRVRRGMEVVELNLDPGFESRYIDQLALPAPVET